MNNKIGENKISKEMHKLLIEQARHMRKNPTKAESMLWKHLRKERLAGWKFRRQHIIRTFIVDFYCPAAKLVIEVDGAVHNSQRDYDKVREDHLQAMGYRILRFTNNEIFYNLPHVLDVITQHLSLY